MNRFALAALIDDVGIHRESGDTRPYALRIADDILAKFAVVELPKPDDNGDFTNVNLHTPPNLPTEINLGRMWFPSDRARSIAAQLLAAADSADRIDAKEARS